MQSACNQHAISMQSARAHRSIPAWCNQHAISMQSACNQHAISMQSARAHRSIPAWCRAMRAMRTAARAARYGTSPRTAPRPGWSVPACGPSGSQSQHALSMQSAWHSTCTQHALSMQSARNQHAISMALITHSACTQHALSMHSARNQHAISMQSSYLHVAPTAEHLARVAPRHRAEEPCAACGIVVAPDPAEIERCPTSLLCRTLRLPLRGRMHAELTHLWEEGGAPW